MTGLKKNLDLSPKQKVDLIERGHPSLSITRQSELIGIARSTIYYKPVINEHDKEIMDLIDRQYIKTPFYGSRRMAAILRRKGHLANRKKIQRLMRVMGLEAIYPKRNLSKPHPDHKVYPYLLNNLDITRNNQVWGTDITYIRMNTGWLYMVAILDWHSRFVVSWELSTTMEIDFCLTAMDNAFYYAIPEIVNSDQGSQFTSPKFLNKLEQADIKISMDGRGRAMDNIFTERLWRSLKYEEVYVKDYQTVREAKKGIEDYIGLYNYERPHQSLKYKTPAEIYFDKGGDRTYC